jgi:hypothetical protein
VEAHVAEFRFAETEIAETKGEMLADEIQLRQEPGGIAVGGEELDDGFKVDGAGLLVEGGASGSAFVYRSCSLTNAGTACQCGVE